MREIKFRIYCDLYDDKSKHMFYNGIWFDDDGYYIENWWYYLDDLRKPYDDEHPETACICEVMQFTWLLDKNGKEIYEGDIVYAFANSKYPKETIISDIICNTADWMRFEVRCSKDSQHWLSIGWWWWESFEVRWNIYENPELIF